MVLTAAMSGMKWETLTFKLKIDVIITTKNLYISCLFQISRLQQLQEANQFLYYVDHVAEG